MATKPAIRFTELPPEKLRWRCDPARIPYETTAQAEPIEGPVGQDRALRALRMGIELAAPGYNIFVCGLAGTSRGGMIQKLIEQLQPRSEPGPDRCYVNNFKNPDRPRLLTLPRGQANNFKKDMQSGIDFLRRRIPQVFEGEPFQRQKGRIVDRYTLREKELMDDFTAPYELVVMEVTKNGVNGYLSTPKETASPAAAGSASANTPAVTPTSAPAAANNAPAGPPRLQ